MSETKVKPTFKPKFTAPVASSTSTLESIASGKTGKKHNDNEEARHSSTTEKSKTESESEVCDTIESETKDKSKRKTSLTDSQYENIFATVTAKVLAADFLDLDERFAGSADSAQTDERPMTDKKKKRKSDEAAAEKTKSDNRPSIRNGESTSKNATSCAVESFRDSVLKKSPNSSRRINEVTPTLSPLDVNDEKLLLKKPEPKRREKKKAANITGKRKSLEFTDKQEKANENLDELRAKSREAGDIACATGIWAQCSACDKWRFLTDCHDPASLPEEWSCSLNPNKEYASCSSPEETWTDSSQDDFVYTKFTPGSIVWAKMAGYPSWPAMVDHEPDFNTFYETFPDGNVSYYHVVFLDDLVSRAWISHRNIEAYRANETPIKLSREGKRGGFVKGLESAKKRAGEALDMAIPDRLVKFAFHNRFRGKSHWSHDKNTTERRMKKKIKESGRKIRSESVKIYENGESSGKNVNGESNENIRDTSQVSEEEACLNEEADESALFSNMVIDEAHDQSDEIPLVLKENSETTRPINLEPDVFTMELGKCQDEENCKPIGLSRKSEECEQSGHQGNDEPLDLNGKKTTNDRLNMPFIKDDEYLSASGDPGNIHREDRGTCSTSRSICAFRFPCLREIKHSKSTTASPRWTPSNAPHGDSNGNPSESLFEDVDMQVEEEELKNPANEADWDDFEKMVME